MSKTFVSPYDIITTRILADLEKGVAAWVKPWSAKGAAKAITTPINFQTNKPYRGINTLLTYCACLDNGWTVPAFATFNQIKAMGGTVKKGSKSEHIFFSNVIERDPKTEEEAARVNANGKYEYRFLKGFSVFNIEQTEGLDLNLEGMAKPSELPAEIVDLCKLVDVKLTHGGDRAFYQPIGDRVNLPAPEAFKSLDHYKATGFHEVGHATGAEHRLNRTFGKKFGDEAYAYEELVAELSAAFLCMEFGVEGQLQHPEYIASWIKVLKGDNRAFYRAAADAQKVLDFIREKAGTAPAAEEEDMKQAA